MHARNAKEAIARGHSIPSDIVFRPIQYLGSKLRSINYIVPNLTRYIAPRSTVFDVFTGTSVVAQALADANMRVVATDVMGFCATFAESLLSIGRAESRIQSPSALFSLLNDYANEGAVSPTYSDLIAEEQSAINSANSEALLSIANRVPAGWKSTSRSSNSPLSWNLSQSISLPELSLKGIIANYYAGTYFGVRQAIAIDKLRISIEIARDANSLSRWEYVTALTALLYACSSAVFSPGKHFAQYHKTDGGKNLTFHKKRILSDRAVDIEHQFLAAMKAIFDRPHDRSISHIVKQLSMEETFADSSWLPKVDLVYADPPYTAQQYSRFYHIPETLINYREPKMQEFRGDYTVGMYPAERFKSRFSSKRQAPGAFDDLIKLSTRLGASLAISYSESASGQTGNDRMIRLDDLAQMCRRGFGTVHIEKLSHAYRQFNDSSAAVEERADHEYLVVCNP
jgi:adenine-specific DNA methylase